LRQENWTLWPLRCIRKREGHWFEPRKELKYTKAFLGVSIFREKLQNTGGVV
jgi:hypothetical protein